MTGRKRKRGEGSVETLPSGLRSVRIRLASGKRPRLQGGHSDEEADDVRVGALAELQDAGLASEGGVTLRHYGPRVLDARELDGSRAVKTERSAWRQHVSTTPFVDWPLVNVTARDVRRWVKTLVKKPSQRQGARPGEKLGAGGAGRALALLRIIVRAAIDDERLSVDPTFGVLPPRGKAGTERPWTWLTWAEQQTFLGHPGVPRWLRLHVAVAIATGMRQSEQWHLRLGDVHTDGDNPRVIVRFSVGGEATKSGRIREVPLLGFGLEAMREWLRMLPHYVRRNPLGLVFPRPNGKARKSSEVPRGWQAARELAGPARRLRWHDLRHTCGTSLLAGWWGRRWALVEVRDVLGHSSVKTTERYAHVVQAELHDAARLTTVPLPVGPRLAHAPQEVTVLTTPVPLLLPASSRGSIIATGAHRAEVSPGRILSVTSTPHGPSVGRLAADLLQRVAAGDSAAALELADQLVASLLEEPATRLALELQRALAGELLSDDDHQRVIALAVTLAAQLLTPAAAGARTSGGGGSL